jgi:hypothetical protein
MTRRVMSGLLRIVSSYTTSAWICLWTSPGSDQHTDLCMACTPQYCGSYNYLYILPSPDTHTIGYLVSWKRYWSAVHGQWLETPEVINIHQMCSNLVIHDVLDTEYKREILNALWHGFQNLK